MEKYNSIIKHYEECLEKYGDSHKGVDWPNEEDMVTRYQVMMDIKKFDPIPSNSKFSVLDFGCGTAQMLGFINRNNYNDIDYRGLDISKKFIDVSIGKFPETIFYCTDIIKDKLDIEPVDYVVMNGVFTEKGKLSFQEMYEYFSLLLIKVFPLAKRGVAFNVMSKVVDWERDDLFHLPLDSLSFFLAKKLSRNFIIRNDYGLYEYTTYIYH